MVVARCWLATLKAQHLSHRLDIRTSIPKPLIVTCHDFLVSLAPLITSQLSTDTTQLGSALLDFERLLDVLLDQVLANGHR